MPASASRPTAAATPSTCAHPRAATSKQPAPQETAAFLEPVVQQLDGIHGAVAAVMEAIGTAQQLTNAVLQGGQPGPLLGRLEAARTTMLAVIQHNNLAE